MHLKYADWFQNQDLTWNYYIDHARHYLKKFIAKNRGISFKRIYWAVILKLNQEI
jgi:hypothetical protein